MIKKIKIFWILVVFSIALFSCFYNISSYPVSLTIDEVGVGYNAYSILKTGKDEWGQRLPLVFKAIDDYKPPVDIYLTAISVKFLGLNELGTRFPSAFLGALSSVILILLLLELDISFFGSILGGLFLAICPWHLNFSRGNFDSIIALFFVLLGVWLLLVWSKKLKTYILCFSIAAFSLSVWSYVGERLFTPLLVLVLILIFRDKFKIFIKKPKKIIFPLITFLIFLIPFIYLGIFTPAIKSRPLSTSIFRESSLMQQLHNGNYKNFLESIFNNDIYIIFRHWLGKYLNYFDLRFWFWKGMGYTPPAYLDIGLFYLVDAPIILFGIYCLFVSKNKLLKNISIAWFFLGPLSASFTMNEQHTIRALTWLPFFGIAFATGAQTIWEKIPKRKLIAVVYLLLLTINIFYFINLYTTQYPKFYSEYWQYGYKDIALYACQNKDKYKEIIISDTFGSDGPLNTGTPYAYVLFYCKYDPLLYLKYGRKIEKFSFRRVDWKHDSTRKDTLLIGSSWDMPLNEIPDNQILKKIYFLNGKLGFVIARSNVK